MSVTGDIESAFLTAAAQITGVEETHDIEPVRFSKLPAVSMVFIACPQVVSSTGYSVVSWTWQVSLTINLSDLRTAQESLKAILPNLLAITRLDQDLGGTCDWADLNDRQEPPFTVEDMKALRKNVYLTAQTTESAGT